MNFSKTHSANRRVLITGGAGFIGSNLAHDLLTRTDAHVHILDNLSRAGVRHNLEWLRSVESGSRLQVTVGDIRDAALIEDLARSADEIYHFAAQVAVTTSVTDPRTDFEINALGTFNVLEAARKSGNRPFLVMTSTNKVYGDMAACCLRQSAERYEYADFTGIDESYPLDFHSPYGCSKGAADQYVRDYGRMYDLPTVVFRMSCIAGQQQFGNEDQGWVAHFLYSALQGKTITVYGDGRQVRDVLNVKDLVRAFHAASEQRDGTAGEIFNIGGGAGNTVSLLELLRDLEQWTGAPVARVHESVRPGDQLIYVTDFSKFKNVTGWQPRSNIQETVEDIYGFWQRNREMFSEQAASVAVSSVAGEAPTPELLRRA
jgi:CDP-paratose 2-epimerase